ncbi:MAG: cyclic nucleotide-binding domain-containing protein [Pseudomonadales bacterium]|nr:cyclic nucleotide-binding domain-containing protein [Pseudomonadales bacterium]
MHLEKLSGEFNIIFSVASPGKRYTIIEGDTSVYIPLVNHYLSQLTGFQSASRWLHNLLAEAQIKKYNQDDIIVVQGDVSHDQVYFILTGYCDVVQHNGTELQTLASLQAGEMIGKMAVITELGLRNASVIAHTPVTICVLYELAFSSFIEERKLKEQLVNLWEIRPILSKLPPFDLMSSTVLNKINKIVVRKIVPAGQTQYFDEHHWYILAAGDSEPLTDQSSSNVEFGWRPFAASNTGPIRCTTDCTLLIFEKGKLDLLRLETPQLNYILRKETVTSDPSHADWLTGNPVTNFGISTQS